EDDAEALAEHALVIRFERRLRRRQLRALRVVDEPEREARALAAVAEVVQDADRANARVVHALAALAIDELLGVAGKRSDDLDAVGGEKLGEPFLARLEEDREVA